MVHKAVGLHGKVRVTFCLPSSFWADTIHVVGDFNDWSPTATPMQLNDEQWSVTLDLDSETSFEYRYLVNNTDWVTDWQSDHFAQGETGGDNSVIVTMLPEHYANAQKRQNGRQRPNLRVLQGGKQEKQAV